MTVDIEVYRKVIYERDSLREEVKELRPLKDDTLRLSRVAQFTMQALVAAQKKSQDNINDYNMVVVKLDTAISKINQQTGIINNQDKLIDIKNKQLDKATKPKNWFIGPVAGYGVSGQSFGAFIGVGVGWGVRF